MEKLKIYCHVTQKFFRQINSVVFSLVKTLLSRNFCLKSVTANFRNFHIVQILIKIAQSLYLVTQFLLNASADFDETFYVVQA